VLIESTPMPDAKMGAGGVCSTQDERMPQGWRPAERVLTLSFLGVSRGIFSPWTNTINQSNETLRYGLG